jgi:hypothetical protein
MEICPKYAVFFGQRQSSSLGLMKRAQAGKRATV